MITVLWNRGPAMRAQMKHKGIDWPRFSRPEMANLGALLETVPGSSGYPPGAPAAEGAAAGSAAGMDKLGRMYNYR